jgi:hypothetical protein
VRREVEPMPKDLLKLQETTPRPKIPRGVGLLVLLTIPIVVVVAIAAQHNDLAPNNASDRTSSPGSVGTDGQSVAMSFEDCLSRIREFAGRYGGAPINVVETNDVRIVRFAASDGSVLISCSRPDRKMVVTISAKR